MGRGARKINVRAAIPNSGSGKVVVSRGGLPRGHGTPDQVTKIPVQPARSPRSQQSPPSSQQSQAPQAPFIPPRPRSHTRKSGEGRPASGNVDQIKIFGPRFTTKRMRPHMEVGWYDGGAEHVAADIDLLGLAEDVARGLFPFP